MNGVGTGDVASAADFLQSSTPTPRPRGVEMYAEMIGKLLMVASVGSVREA
jgi:hypothetical protein